MILQITNNDFVFIGLAALGAIIFGFVIFSAIMKNKEPEIIIEEDKDEFFPEIKPKTEEQKEAKEEIEKVFHQMASDLEKQKERNTIDEFEKEQEENAIISYQELIKQAKQKQEIIPTKKEEIKIPIKEEKEEIKLPIIEKEEEKEITAIKDKEEKISQMELELEEEPKKFKNSEIISPIFGIQGSPSYKKPVVKKGPKAKHAYTEDKQKETENKEFLRSLKAFRENL